MCYTPVAQSQFRPRFTTVRPDLRQMVKLGCIGMCRDGKNRKSSINMVFHDAPTVFVRFVYGSTTTHDGSATIHHGGATNAHDAPTIRYSASTIQAGSATVASRPPTLECARFSGCHAAVLGGGGTIIFS